ncbi:MAG: HEAT repeat domain-containing protein [Prolixibacteraceae bacterium]|jgi:hypothetical protein|nr:HEAT repeat domain-containing protein [Prolixibacteraceae bacterium]
MDNKKVNDSIIKKLYSNDSTQVSNALDDIKLNGNSNYIPILVDVLHKNENQETIDKILKILSEIKHTDAVPELIKAIENEKYANIHEMLVRVCWENGLDFTNNFSTFIDILINGDYMTAFEAFTVIENSEGTLSETSADEYINSLNKEIENVPKDRATLIKHTIEFLPSLVK